MQIKMRERRYSDHNYTTHAQSSYPTYTDYQSILSKRNNERGVNKTAKVITWEIGRRVYLVLGLIESAAVHDQLGQSFEDLQNNVGSGSAFGSRRIGLDNHWD